MMVTPLVSLVVMLTQTATPLRGTALLVSTGRLEGSLAQYGLRGTDNDVRLMAEMLHHKYGVPKSQIALLGVKKNDFSGYNVIAEVATASNIQATFNSWLVARKGAYDAAVFGISGHGGQAYIGNRQQEFVVTQDGTALMDWEIRGLLAKIPEKKVTVLLDTCHSEGGIKGVAGSSIRRKLAPPDLSKSVKGIRADPGHPSPGTAPESPNHILLAAASRNSAALEVGVLSGRLGSRSFGLFTLELYRYVMRSEADLTVGQTMTDVAHQIRNVQGLGQRPEEPRLVKRSLVPRSANLFWLPVSSRAGLPVQGGRVPAGALVGLSTQTKVLLDGKPTQIMEIGWFDSVLSQSAMGSRARLRYGSKRSDVSFRRYVAGRDIVSTSLRRDNDEPPTVRIFTSDTQGTVTTPDGLTYGGLAGGSKPDQLVAAFIARDQVAGWVTPGGPLTLSPSHEFADFKLNPERTEGETFTMEVRSRGMARYIALLSFEPGGEIAWHRETSQPDGFLGVELEIKKPEGPSLLVAVASSKPIRFEALARGLDGVQNVILSGQERETRIVPVRHVPNFVDRLFAALASNGQLDYDDVSFKSFTVRAIIP